MKKISHLTVLTALELWCACATACVGQVVDTVTLQPVPDAIVTHGSSELRSSKLGKFEFSGPCTSLSVRAIGYRRPHSQTATEDESAVFHLTPFRPKAVYLSFWGIGSKTLRENALELTTTTEINALVIDIKGDRGGLPYRSQVAMAEIVGAQKVHVVPDMKALVATLKERGIYLIARIVVFKDTPLVNARPEWAVRDGEGRIYHDREDQAWIDPSQHQAWSYYLDIAAEAAELGFDEIQFDYLRFPDTPGLKFSTSDTEHNRVTAIGDFLSEARHRLMPFNVFLAADIFGYVPWNQHDTQIGQRLETFTGILDYVSPMLYPSGFQYGIPGYTNSVAHPYEIVRLTLEHAAERTGVSPLRFRPWLQAFRDYAFDRRPFEGHEIRKQIDAAEHFGSDGWMLWNPRNAYTSDGLTKRPTTAIQLQR
jgi:hypothetical protein